MKHQIERKTAKNAAEERGQTCALREGASAPNSALAAAYETDYLGFPNLESSILSRLPGKPQPQIPTAENEADRLSAGVAAGGPEEVKRELGSRLGADFSKVRFHTDAGAAAYADEIGARAYTTGSDVYFGTGGFEPSVAAHELVHTVQQGSVGSDAATMSAPSGGIQMFRNPFRRRKSSDAPGQISPGTQVETLKKASGSDLASVARLSTSSGPAVLKPRDNPMLEAAVADFYNAGGSMFGRRGSNWSFDAPGVRGLRASERGQVTGMFGHTLAGPGDGETAEGLADRAALYQFVEGTSRTDPRANRKDNEGKLTEAPEDIEDYQRTMGRVALMDLITGNGDRVFSATNFDNWTEDRERQRIHLIDNAFNAHGGMGMASAERAGIWDQETRGALTGSRPGEAPSLQNFFAYTRSATESQDDKKAAELVHGGVSEAYQGGATEAAGMLPQLYGRLREQYASSSGGHMNEHQTELLRRVNALHGMLNPDALPLDMPARPAGPAPRPGVAPKRKWWQRLFGSAH
ncbi:MAG: DUF4157 domain-containing protein [Oscillibacter sp.]|nr:DUF4157 domain-containing protein [Oscillibacter sp.]